MNSLLYLELAKQLSRDHLDDALGRTRPRPQRRPTRPKLPTVPLRWRPARTTTPSPIGCTA
jgi:hypothetical protein